MPRYLVENYSAAEHFVTNEAGETKKLLPMGNVTADLSEEHARALRNSAGLRVTHQRLHKEPAAPADDQPARPAADGPAAEPQKPPRATK